MTEEALIDREVVVRQLQEARPRSRFLRISAAAFMLLVIYSWSINAFDATGYLSARRQANLQRFLGELRPYPLRYKPWDAAAAGSWAMALFVDRAGPAAVTTVAISIAAISIAGLAGALLAFPASRAYSSAEPYAPAARVPSKRRRMAWSACVAVTRAALIFLRAIPEYVWAFLALAVIGPNVWAAVLALAIHNSGILGKLDAEVVENLEPTAMMALRSLGATRLQIALSAIRPAILPRLLLLFFYRWEACVREATVLGMLGIVSLGFYIQDARVRQHYDAMFGLILAGAIVVMIGDVVSALARATVRRAD